MVRPVLRPDVRLALVVLPYLILAAVILARMLVGVGTGMLPLLALGPAFAAITGGLRHTALVGALALALAPVLALLQPPADGLRQELVAVVAVVGVTAASVAASAVRRQRDQELAEVRTVAEVAQRVLLRPVLPRIGPVTFSVRYISASAQAQIGGDLYAAVATPAGVRLIVGDVEGRGLPAVQTAATVLGAFRESAYDESCLAAIAARIERSLARQRADGHFVTAIIAEVAPDGSRIGLLNCGHPLPLLVTGKGSRFVGPDEGGLPLGLSGLADFPRTPACVPFAPGDQMLLYTDGVTEARNAAGDFFPLTTVCCVRDRHLDPEVILERLSGEIRRHVGHTLEDDVAMLLIRRGES